MASADICRHHSQVLLPHVGKVIGGWWQEGEGGVEGEGGKSPICMLWCLRPEIQFGFWTIQDPFSSPTTFFLLFNSLLVFPPSPTLSPPSFSSPHRHKDPTGSGTYMYLVCGSCGLVGSTGGSQWQEYGSCRSPPCLGQRPMMTAWWCHGWYDGEGWRSPPHRWSLPLDLKASHKKSSGITMEKWETWIPLLIAIHGSLGLAPSTGKTLCPTSCIGLIMQGSSLILSDLFSQITHEVEGCIKFRGTSLIIFKTNALCFQNSYSTDPSPALGGNMR